MTIEPITTNRVLDRLRAGEVVMALSVRQARTVDIAHIAHNAGFDSLYIDMEHSSMSIDTASAILTAALSIGITPLVRTPDGNAAFLSRCLDAGALGIIVPQIRSAEQAHAIVAAVKYPPLGERSVSSALPQFGYRSVPMVEATRVLNDNTAVVAMIETVDAIEAIDAIAAVRGLDVLLIGVNDLTQELGIPGQFDHPKALAAYDRIAEAGRAHGVHVGVGGLPGKSELIAHLLRRGIRFISAATDLGLLSSAASDAVTRLRLVIEEAGHEGF